MATKINTIREINNPQRAYEFEVEVLGSTASGTFPLFTQRVKNVTIPNVVNEVFEINFKGKKTQHSGRDGSAKTVSVEIYDTQDRDAYTFFYNWMNGINDTLVGGGVTKDVYKGEVVIKTFAADSESVTGTNRLINAWPSELGDISLDYTNNDAMSFSVTFSFDENIVA
jgi:hypothetical protein